MVKLKGPGISAGASGTLANVLTFSNSPKGGYAKKHSVPANPKSTGQVGTRCCMSFLSQAWAPIFSGPKTYWTPLGEAANISPYNAYLKLNLNRWATFDFPTERPTTYPAFLNADILFAQILPLERSLRIQVNWLTQNHNWGIVIFRSTSTGFAPAPSNAIAMLRWKYGGSPTIVHIDADLPAGTYYYRFRTFAIRGTAADTHTSEYFGTLT